MKYKVKIQREIVCKDRKLFKDVGVGPKSDHIYPKWDKSGTFQDQFQYILALLLN